LGIKNFLKKILFRINDATQFYSSFFHRIARENIDFSKLLLGEKKMNQTIAPFSQRIMLFLISVLNLNVWSMVRVEANSYQYRTRISNPYIDHIENFEKLFSAMKVDSFLEFGLGEGTRYFLDHCQSVTSVEIKLPEQSDEWYNNCLNAFQEATNWNPILYHGSQTLSDANLIALTQSIDPAQIDASYLLEIKSLCDSLFQNKKFDIAFVDPGIHQRGDIVNELFNRVDVIVAHDTGYSFVIYGWNKIQTPPNYERFDFNNGCGTTFWVRNNRTDVIMALKKNK
jgi:hypothetical protein